MCGIVGVIGTQIPKEMLEKMTNVLAHRGPDDGGIYQDKYANLGHRRLSIIDLSPLGRQPMFDNDKKLIIVYNGEIYNYLELKKELSDGYHFRTATDTEVILAAYLKWKDNCVLHFNGMFAFAIWDIEKHRLFCARDRLGIKPFYYCMHDDCLAFASELKPFFILNVPIKPDYSTVFEYFSHGYYHHSEKTFFNGMLSLPPASTLVYENNNMNISKYWDVPFDMKLKDIKFEEASEIFMHLLKRSVSLQLRSDVPVGLNLSGGLDSSSLLVLMDEQSRKKSPLHAFTLIYGDALYDEDTCVKELAKFKNEWTFSSVKFPIEQFWEEANNLLWYIEAPYGGLSTIAYFSMNKVLKYNGITVLLEGQGVDEILAGYNYYREDSCDVYQDGTSYLHPEFLKKDFCDRNAFSQKFHLPFSNDLNNKLYRDMRFTKLPRVLCFNDRATMASSKELRVPFLDHNIVEFAFSLPNKFKICNGLTKYLLRETMKNTLPDSIRSVPKRSVVNPQREWFANSMKAEIKNIFESKTFKQREIWDSTKIEQAYNSYCNKMGDNSQYIWQFLNIELWLRMFIDSNGWMKNPNVKYSPCVNIHN